ncbi:MAG TPA: SMP-30/gluconolactonase/LRE family protein [Acidimicrobiia bacterium]|nr:SMP-30/gluconolactonase/LRE family protein [Acidimicrobiia bacterium]
MLLATAACGANGDDAPARAAGDSDQLLIRRDVDRFVSLSEGVRFPEGITANPANGDIYVGTFDVPSDANPNPKNKLLRFDRHGELIASHDFGTTPLLGLAFDHANNQVYIADAGNFAGATSKIQRIAADLTGVTDVAVIPEIGPPEPRPVGNPDGSSDTITFGDHAHVPNAMVFDSRRNLYVSDSFQGAVFKVTDPQACAPNCPVETFSHDPLLATPGMPPFGANGLVFNGDESALFIANTGDDRLLRLDMASGTKKVSILAENINGADGIAFDRHGRLWVAANQADEVVALSETGRVVAELGEFRGIRRDDGTPDGLLFPASLVIVDDDMFVTNLAASITEATGDEPEEDVRRWTVSHVKVPTP